MVITCYLFRIASQSAYFHRHVRRFLADYGMPIALVASSGMAYWGRFNHANPTTLPVGKAFQPAGGRDWLVRFWQLDGKWVGIAFPFGFALWVLFFFDHNVSVRTSFLSHEPPFLMIHTLSESHGTRESVSAEEASRIPLRLFHFGNNNVYCRFIRHSRSEWTHPPGANTYDLPPCNGYRVRQAGRGERALF